ncbi:TPA: hypothetical protein MM166_004285 [Klebsiella pneumoniae]|nr:hypothetical protein [Klebsiella pneumoniae]
MKYKLLILLLFICFSSSAITENEFVKMDKWRLFDKLTDGSEIYTKGGVIDGDITSIWYKSISPPLTECSNGNVLMTINEKMICESLKKIKTKTEIARVFYECKKRKLRFTDRTIFNYFGEVIYSGDSVQKWKSIIPDTLAEDLYYEVCNY